MSKTIIRAVVFAVAVVMALVGCSTFVAKEARDLYAQGKPEEALERLNVALKADPTNPELRSVYLSLREQALQEWMDQANRASARGDTATAEAYYRRVLRLQSGHDQARAGLEALAKENRHRALLKEAKDLIVAKESDLAAVKLRTVLAEWPLDSETKELLSVIDRDIATQTGAKLNPSLQKKLSILFKDATVKQVFDVLSAETGINFVFDKDVKTDAKVNVALKDTTGKNALDTVLTASQLESSLVGPNSFLIYPNTPAKVKDYKVLVVKAFFLSNASVEDVANTLKTIAKIRDVVVDKSKNLIIVRDTPDAIRVAEKLVYLQDLPSPEVMIAIEILEVNRTRLAELGINFPGQLSLTPLASATGGTVTLRDLLNINAGTTGATISPLIINANATDTDIKILANPRIRAKDRETAKILIGDRFPNITSTATSTGFISSSVQYIDVGLKLEITPIVSIDNEISIKIALEVSNISNQITTTSGTVAYQIGTRTASTVLRLKDGENQILAGLISNEDRLTNNKIPGLGDIPIIGRLFSNQKNDLRKSEIILSITPRVLRNTPRQALTALEFESGSESKLRNTGLASGPAGNSVNLAAGGASPSSQAVQAASGPTVTSTSNGGPPNTITANLIWSGPSQVKIGDTFQLQLQLGSSQPMSAIPYTLAFDPGALEVTAVGEGDLLKQGGPTTFSQRVDRSTGQIFIANARSDTSPGKPGTGGTGTLLNLTVKALAATTATNIQVVSMSPQSSTETQVTVALPSMYTISITP